MNSTNSEKEQMGGVHQIILKYEIAQNCDMSYTMFITIFIEMAKCLIIKNLPVINISTFSNGLGEAKSVGRLVDNERIKIE